MASGPFPREATTDDSVWERLDLSSLILITLWGLRRRIADTASGSWVRRSEIWGFDHTIGQSRRLFGCRRRVELIARMVCSFFSPTVLSAHDQRTPSLPSSISLSTLSLLSKLLPWAVYDPSNRGTEREQEGNTVREDGSWGYADSTRTSALPRLHVLVDRWFELEDAIEPRSEFHTGIRTLRAFVGAQRQLVSPVAWHLLCNMDFASRFSA